jgi:hypothetical protein
MSRCFPYIFSKSYNRCQFCGKLGISGFKEFLCLPLGGGTGNVRYLLVGDVPEAQLPVEAAGEEVAVVPRVEHDGRHEVDVLEATQALPQRDVP